GLVASAAGWALRYAGIDVSNHGVRAAIETGGSLVSAVAGFLVWGRARRTASRADVVLAAILFVLAGVNLSVGLLPALVAPNAELFAGWTPDAARLIPAVGFVVAAVSGDRALDRPQRELLRVVVLGMLFLATVIAAGAALAEPATAARLVL